MQRRCCVPSQTPIERINALGTYSFNTSLTQLPLLTVDTVLRVNRSKGSENPGTNVFLIIWGSLAVRGERIYPLQKLKKLHFFIRYNCLIDEKELFFLNNAYINCLFILILSIERKTSLNRDYRYNIIRYSKIIADDYN